MRMKILISVVVTIFLSGCFSSGVVPLTDNKFVISKNSAKVGGGVSASVMASVNKEANAFCAAKGKKVSTIDMQLSPGRAGSLGNVTLQFACI